jgi:hypothetical protein
VNGRRPATTLSRLALTTAAAATVAVVVAAPAAAQQRDPFDPVVGSSAEVSTDTGQTTSPAATTGATESTTTAPATQTAPDDGTLPMTGGHVTAWLAVAYVLIAGGVAALALARTLGAPGRKERTGSSPR